MPPSSFFTLAQLTTQKLLIKDRIHNSNYNSHVNRIAIAIGRKLIVHFKQLQDHKEAQLKQDQQKKAEDESPQPKTDLVKKPISPSKRVPTH